MAFVTPADKQRHLRLYRVALQKLGGGEFTQKFGKVDCPRLPLWENVEIQAFVGAGSYADVYRGVLQTKNLLIAIKKQKKAPIPAHQKAWVVAEKKFLCAMSSLFVPSVHGTWQDLENLYLYLDYGHYGDLDGLLSRGPFTEAQWLPVMAQLTCAFEYIHACGVVFIDVKPANILIFKGGRIKVADFGLASQVEDITNGFKGSLLMQPPEMFELNLYTESGDWWALGFIFYTMLFDEVPFGLPPHVEDKELVRAMTSVPLVVHDTKGVSDAAVSLVLDMLDLDVTRRIGTRKDGVTEVKTHPFFKGTDFYSMVFEEEIALDLPVEVTDGVPDDGTAFKNIAEANFNDENFGTY